MGARQIIMKVFYVLMFCMLVTVPVCADVIHIPDVSLEQAIRETLQLPNNAAITADDMRQLKQLEILSGGVTTLEGQEFATELQQLAIPLNLVIDLTPISALVKLTHSLDRISRT